MRNGRPMQLSSLFMWQLRLALAAALAADHSSTSAHAQTRTLRVAATEDPPPKGESGSTLCRMSPWLCKIKQAAEKVIENTVDTMKDGIHTMQEAVGLEEPRQKPKEAHRTAEGKHELPLMNKVDMMRTELCWDRENLHEHEDCLKFLGIHCGTERTGKGICTKFKVFVHDDCLTETDPAEKDILCTVAEWLHVREYLPAPMIAPGPAPAPVLGPAPKAATAPAPSQQVPPPLPASAAPAASPFPAPAWPPQAMPVSAPALAPAPAPVWLAPAPHPASSPSPALAPAPSPVKVAAVPAPAPAPAPVVPPGLTPAKVAAVPAPAPATVASPLPSPGKVAAVPAPAPAIAISSSPSPGTVPATHPAADTDGDGVSDAEDAWPLNPKESKDMDGDGEGDNADIDRDGDGVPNSLDAFPEDKDEYKDSNKNGIGDNAERDRDDDGVPDKDDAFPDNPFEWKDSDGDGVGDNADQYPFNKDCYTTAKPCRSFYNKVRRPLPPHGYDEFSRGEPHVEHGDDTVTGDWRREWPKRDETHSESIARICKEHPQNTWCKEHT